jgi:hypothetical protein
MRGTLLLLLGLALAQPPAARAQDQPKKTAEEQTAEMVRRGLQWLAKNQHRDGYWAAQNNYRTAMTGLAGLALLAEGSTTAEGKYADNLRRAVRYLVGQAQPSGLINDANDPSMAGRYIIGHGYALLFLCQVYAVEKDEKHHAELGKVLQKAVEFAAKSITNRGGWGYVSAKDGNNFDEGCCTLVTLHALYAAKLAGIPVPRELLDKGQEYLKKSTVEVKKDAQDPKMTEAGILYSLTQGGAGGARQPLTVAALAVAQLAGTGQSERAIQWLNFCASQIQLRAPTGFAGYDEYTQFYLAFVTHALGEQGHAGLRPDLAEASRWTWSRFKGMISEQYRGNQAADGSWVSQTIGPVYGTAMRLIVLQVDRKNLTVVSR